MQQRASINRERRAALEAEAAALIAELKRRHADDLGNVGVPNKEYVANWAGVRLRTPQEDLPTLLVAGPEAFDRQDQGVQTMEAAGTPADSAPISENAPRVTDAEWRQIDEEMNAAFRRNIAKSKADSARHAATSPTVETPSTKGPVVSAAVLKKIDDEMDAAFWSNIARSQADREARRVATNQAEGASATPSTKEPRVSDAESHQIQDEMNRAFEKNVAKSRGEREKRERLREAGNNSRHGRMNSFNIAQNAASSHIVSWKDVLPIANEGFHIWVDQPELRWAEQAWAHLTNAGLAPDVDPLDRLRAYIRFLVLASFYRDWCALACDEVEDDSPEIWLSAVEVNLLHVGQLLGPDEDPEDDLNEALNTLMRRERPAVVAAVLEGFGGVSGLFVALWRSNKGLWEDPPADDEDDGGAHLETEDEILNEVTSEKMAGYEWIEGGCETRGPVRSTAEMDDWSD
jgi:hypothetical protein